MRLRHQYQIRWASLHWPRTSLTVRDWFSFVFCFVRLFPPNHGRALCGKGWQRCAALAAMASVSVNAFSIYWRLTADWRICWRCWQGQCGRNGQLCRRTNDSLFSDRPGYGRLTGHVARPTRACYSPFSPRIVRVVLDILRRTRCNGQWNFRRRSRRQRQWFQWPRS